MRKYLSSCYMKNSFREIFIKSFATIEGHEIPLPLCFSQGSTLYIRGKFAIPLKIVSFFWYLPFIRLFPVVFTEYQIFSFFFFHPLALWSIQLQALVGFDFIAPIPVLLFTCEKNVFDYALKSQYFHCNCVVDESSSGMEYVDLLINPERFTGYAGFSAQRVWNNIYKENCFK